MKKLFVLTVILALSLVGSAAAGTITFSGINENKSFSYNNTGTTPFSVTGLSIDTLTLSNVGSFSISGGSLSITSGNRTGSTGTPTNVSIAFAPGGALTITGAISSLGISGTLLSGTFLASSASFTTPTTPGGFSGGGFGGGVLVSYINPAIFTGNILSASEASTVLSVHLSGASSTNYSGTIQTSNVTLVPEPGSLALLGFGAMALPWSLRKHLVRR